MTSGIIEKEIYGLTEENIIQLFQYAKFLKSRNTSEGNYAMSAKREAAKTHKRKIGTLADGFVSISPDFDDTIEGLEDYI